VITARTVPPATVATTVPTPHPLLAAVFADLDRAAVPWCVLRGADELDAPHGDVDLVVGAGDRTAVDRIVSHRGFVRIPAWGYGSHRAFVAFSDADGTWLKLDIVTRLDFGPYFELRTSLASRALAGRRRLGAIAVPSPDDEFWALLLHCLLDKGTVTPRHQASLQRLAPLAHDAGPVAAFVARWLPEGWAPERVRAAAREGDRTELDALAVVLEDTMRGRQPVRTRATVLRNRWARRAGRVGLPKRPGLTVALLAPDGAGKSTAVARLRGALPLPVQTIYMGLYPRDQRSPTTRVPGVGTLVRLVRQWRGYLLGRRYRRSGWTVLFDRYCYDARLSEGHRGGLHRLRSWALGHACPPPDLTVVLDAPGAVLYRRKPEHAPEDLERRRQGYLTLAARSGWTVVDASKDLEDVQRDLSGVIWQALRTRVGRS
jgi:hypothetical protein